MKKRVIFSVVLSLFLGIGFASANVLNRTDTTISQPAGQSRSDSAAQVKKPSVWSKLKNKAHTMASAAKSKAKEATTLAKNHVDDLRDKYKEKKKN